MAGHPGRAHQRPGVVNYRGFVPHNGRVSAVPLPSCTVANPVANKGSHGEGSALAGSSGSQRLGEEHIKERDPLQAGWPAKEFCVHHFASKAETRGLPKREQVYGIDSVPVISEIGGKRGGMRRVVEGVVPGLDGGVVIIGGGALRLRHGVCLSLCQCPCGTQAPGQSGERHAGATAAPGALGKRHASQAVTEAKRGESGEGRSFHT